jgi:hypothetical protein
VDRSPPAQVPFTSGRNSCGDEDGVINVDDSESEASSDQDVNYDDEKDETET